MIFTVGLSCANAEVLRPATAKLALKITNFKRFLFMWFPIAVELILLNAGQVSLIIQAEAHWGFRDV
jgi:hypothetical protein